MNTSKITLEQMLLARESRAALQGDMLRETGMPLICFTMNIPGPVKRTPLSDMAFNAGLEALLKSIAPAKLKVLRQATGSEAYIASDMPAEELKRIAVEIEEQTPVGRLYDMDVITIKGKLSRSEARRCVVCGGEAAACARSRAHGLDEVLRHVNALLADFAAEQLGRVAEEALVAEVMATPKPGLVDAASCGAHKDMTLETFIKSAAALRGYFCSAAGLGMSTVSQPPAQVMAALKRRGIAAEEEMLAATCGANTHKGMVYSLGILLCAMGRALVTGGEYMEAAKALAADDANISLQNAKRAPVTHGDAAYAKSGAKGARGEAAAGFPGAVQAAKLLKFYAAQGHCKNDACALTLCDIMANTADTNLLHRGGEAGLAFAQAEARRVCALPVNKRIAALAKLDAVFIARNLSPGGCADILALGLFLNRAEQLMSRE